MNTVTSSLAFMVVVSLAVYGLVFLMHALRHRISQAPFFALLGCLAAVTVWVTDTATRIHVGPFTFLFGSVVFFVALLLGVFLSYVLDGTHSGQMAIAGVAGVTILTPLFALLTGQQMTFPGTEHAYPITQPSVRMYLFSAFAMVADLVAMAVVWQFSANMRRPLPLLLRVFAALLTALWVDVLIFTVGVFHADPAFWQILRANIVSRLLLAAVVSPLLMFYLKREMKLHGAEFGRRPLLAILQSSSRTEHELSLAQKEIERRRAAERALQDQLRFRESLLEAIPYPVFFKDKNGRYLGGNRAFESGMSKEHKGRTAAELFPAAFAEMYNQEDERLLREPGIHSYETKAVGVNGESIDVILCKSTFVDNEDQIAGVLGILIDITERKLLEKRLEELAMRDPLTGALNRRSFILSLEEEIARTKRYGGTFSVIMLDGDRFKGVNDRFGHAAGDEVLKRIVQVCREESRDSDVVCRLGGEEFAVLALGASIVEAEALAERIRMRLEKELIQTEAGPVRVTASFGVAGCESGCHFADEILQRADTAMYKAKNAGGNRVARAAQ